MNCAYIRAFGRLLQDLETGVANDIIGASLAAVIRQSRPRAAELRVIDGAMEFDGEPVNVEEVPESATIVTAFTKHRLRVLRVAMGITPREVLQLMALLAMTETASSEGTVFDAAQRLGFWHLTLTGDAPVRVLTPSVSARPEPAPLGSIEDAAQYADAFRAELDGAVADGNATGVAHALLRVIGTERAAVEAGDTIASDIALRWTASVGEVMTRPALQMVAGLLRTEQVPRDQVLEILSRSGCEGTAALMPLLIASPSLMQRRTYFNAIVELGAGVSVLVGYLVHTQWFVVRNAACLLGAMRAAEGEAALIAALPHADERVRMSIATALVQIGTPTGRRALERAIRDASSEVRRRALRGLLNADGLARSAAVLSEALDLERDPEVQLEVIASLRQIATPHAVQQLMKVCSPHGLAGKPAEYRQAAMEALVDLRPTAAAPLLRIQSQDRDPETRAFAIKMLERVTKAA